MSEESTAPDLLERTRRAYQYASDRNWDALLSFYGPGSVWDMSPMGLGTYKGPAATRGFFEEWTGSYEEYEIEPEEILDLGSGVIFSVVRQSARLAGSTGYVSLHYAGVFVWKEGVVARLTNYGDIDEARTAAQQLAQSRG
jgi:hypothetical protein